MAEPRQFTHDDYTVGWICALPKTELVAAGAMLDEEHPVLLAADQDTNSYVFGRIGTHNIVIACLPAETTGKVSAATVAKDMVRSFKSIRFGLMVGIGGGAPYYGTRDNNDAGCGESEDSDLDSEEDDFGDIRDIRLGDVVISLHSKSTEAVVQYDFGKSVQGKEFIHTGGRLNKPPNIVLSAVATLQGQHERKGHKILEQLMKMALNNPLIATKFHCPGSAKDRLFKSDVIHIDGKSCKACCGPLDINLVKRKDRNSSDPSLHYGTIGSADQVMKDATLRDKWAEKEKIICFEMEAAGLMDSFPCLVIRGICDYADSHKNKIWQPYAAATAAAYAKELLLIIPGQGVIDLPPIEQTGNNIIQQLGKWRQSDEENKCLQAFRTTNYETQKNLNPISAAGTCLWCLDNKKFRKWRAKTVSCLLWVTADPGCGKSVLSKFLADKELQATRARSTCYFFFKDDNEDQKTATNALCALLHQLFSQKPELLGHAVEVFNRNGEGLLKNIDLLWNLLATVSADPQAGEIICILDALDECKESELKMLLQKLCSFYEEQVRPSTKMTLKFLVTSRPLQYIADEFNDLSQKIPTIQLAGEEETDQISSEINIVIENELARMQQKWQLSEPTIYALQQGFSKVKHRTYLWLKLVFELIRKDLNSVTRKGREKIFDTIPDSVNAAYTAILDKSTDKDQAKKLLQIVCAATRPLSVKEMSIAMSIQEDDRTYEGIEIPSKEYSQRWIRNLCGLFVSVVNGRVYLLHQTAKEFLIAQSDLSSSTVASGGTWQHSLSIQDSNLRLAYSCIWYLRLEDFRRKNYISQEELRINQLVSKYDFLDYSALNWAVHFRAAMIPEYHSLIALGLELCDVQANRYMSWELIYWQKS